MDEPEAGPEPTAEVEPSPPPPPADPRAVVWLAGGDGSQTPPSLARYDEESETATVDGALALDDTHRLYLVRADNLSHVIVVADEGGRIRGELRIAERVWDAGVLDVVGDETLEVVVGVERSRGLSTTILEWWIYAFRAPRTLKRLAVVPIHYGYGVKCDRYWFVNEVAVPEVGRIVVENVHFDDDEGQVDMPKTAPRHPGASYELRFDAGRFRRTVLPDHAMDASRAGCSDPEGSGKVFKGDPLGDHLQ
jgi:hypothetical protein